MNVLVSLFNSLPGAAGQGLIWGIMAIGVYITYKILDVADLTVDGSLATGGAVAALCVSMGWNPWLAVLAAVSLEEQPVRLSTPAAAITPIREIKVLRFISKNSFLS